MSRLRGLLIILAVFALLSALWGGWIRLGWRWPVIQPDLVFAHGPLMVSGFLGTLIALERAVALRRVWMYSGPLLSGLGALALILGIPGLVGPVMMFLASVCLVAIFMVIVRKQLALYTVVMAIGALSWMIGNLLWILGWPVYRIVLWWAAFLILTIGGERLELGRLLRLSRQIEILFLMIVSLLISGLIFLLPYPAVGTRLVGLALLGLALWLLRFDIARHTVKKKGLPRFAAACLLSGYVWLGIGGILCILFGLQAAGPRYDALLHSLFLGFIISMIFGHAPIIFPALLQLPVTYSPAFYIHLGVLHLSLLLRVAGDLLASTPLRLVGGLLNGIAILIFLGSTILAIRRSSRTVPTAPGLQGD